VRARAFAPLLVAEARRFVFVATRPPR
jgi:hypothetical protein